MRVRRPHAVTFLALVALAVAVAGCGGGGSSVSPPTTADGKSATLGVADHDLGDMLVDSQGRTLYLFAKDTGPKSTCTDACLTYWPPLTATGMPSVGSGVDASLVKTALQADGSKQVLYDGHLLYLYAGDSNPGDENGQTVSAYGGNWYAVAPSGAAITTAVSGGGGGY